MKDVFKRTRLVEKTVTFHNTKVYFAASPAGGKTAQDQADAFQQDMQRTWSGTWTNLFGKTTSVKTEFVQDDPNKTHGIEVVANLDEVNMSGPRSDNLIMVVSPKVISDYYGPIGDAIGGGDADAFVQGNLMVLNPSQFALQDMKSGDRQNLNKISVGAHELGHWGGLKDNLGGRAMYNLLPQEPTVTELNFFGIGDGVDEGVGGRAANNGGDYGPAARKLVRMQETLNKK